jgi:hypothetical protein
MLVRVPFGCPGVYLEETIRPAMLSLTNDMKVASGLRLAVVVFIVCGQLAARAQGGAPTPGGSAVGAPAPPQTLTVRNPFVGWWKLVYRDTPQKDGNVKREEEHGRLVYDERGNMAVQLVRAGRDMLPAGADPKQAISMFAAYWGTYVVDEVRGTLVHWIEGAPDPSQTGKSSPHTFKFLPDGKLALTSASSTSTWERIK